MAWTGTARRTRRIVNDDARDDDDDDGNDDDDDGNGDARRTSTARETWRPVANRTLDRQGGGDEDDER